MANNMRNGNHEALGLIETKGLIATIAATDAMCKAANVTLAGQVQIGRSRVAREFVCPSRPDAPLTSRRQE